MNPRKNNFGMIALIGFLTVMTIVSIGWYTSRPQTRVSAIDSTINQSVPKQGNVPINTVSQNAASNSLPVNSIPQSQTVNGTTVDLILTKIIDTGVEIDVCYPTPDGGEWYPLPGHIYYGNYEVSPDEAGIISDQKPDGVNMGRHCEALYYRINDLSTISTPIRFTFLGYWAEPRELPPCENFQQRLNSSPIAKAYGLKAICKEDGQGGFSVTLAGKAPSVAQNKAQQALDEIVKGRVDGPWEFTINQISQ